MCVRIGDGSAGGDGNKVEGKGGGCEGGEKLCHAYKSILANL